MKKEILNIETVHQCNCCMGCKTLHPLVSVIDLSKANLEQRTIRCDFYTIILMEGEAGELTYGRKYYDYSNATLIFRTPGESIKLGINNILTQKGLLLAFHPELIAHTALGSHIKEYSFFFYKLNESLHLSSREKMKIIECIRNIEEELRHSIDCHSKTKLLLSEYISSGKLEGGVLPTEEYCADALRLSPCYFGDLLRFETGKSIHEYFQLMRLNIAKKMLLDKENTVGTVAKKLGYANTQYFTGLFKKITGMTPTEYKYVQN